MYQKTLNHKPTEESYTIISKIKGNNNDKIGKLEIKEIQKKIKDIQILLNSL